MEEKKSLRHKIGTQMQQLSAAERKRKSELIIRQICRGPWWEPSVVVCAYFSFRQEVETGPLLVCARAAGKVVGLPRISGSEILFHDVTGTTVSYVKHPLGVCEPAAETPLLDLENPVGPILLIIPGTAFDRQGHRLGKGGGFYDRFLFSRQHGRSYLRLGICFSEQLVLRVPVGPHDIGMDIVITEQEVLDFR